MLENYEPFEAVTILHKLPLQIECLTYCGPTLLVGTNQGHLLSYSISGLDKCPSIQLLKSHKSFSKRPIQQLEAVVPLSLLISLSDGTVSVHNLDTLKALSVLDRTRGASLFACCHQTPADPGGGSGRQSNLRLCVHVKQRLLLYHWPPGAWQFAELRQELALPAAARAVSWIGPTALCVALKTDYFRIRVDDGEILELFPFSPATGPVMAPVERNTLALCSKDSKTMFVNEKGRWRRGQKSNDGPLMVKWSKEPLLLQYLAPFLIGICADFVEVRTVDQRTSLIQNLDIPSLRSVSQHRGVLFAASAKSVYCLHPRPLSAQIKVLIQRRDFELALRLHEIGQSDPDRADELRDIDVSLVKCHYAFNLFCQRQFAESLDLLELLSIDPANVVAMYPIAPREFRDRFSGQDLLESYFALAKYLSSVRKKLLAQIAQKVPPPPPIQFYTVDKYQPITADLEKLRQLVDTSLLKCYLESNPALVPSLLRTTNYCHLREAEACLKQKRMWPSLLLLYKNNNDHESSLKLLMEHYQQPGSQISNIEDSVQYLQELGVPYQDLIFRYSRWIIERDPKEGLRIFTESQADGDNALPRIEVANFLESSAPQLLTDYLEHCVLHSDRAFSRGRRPVPPAGLPAPLPALQRPGAAGRYPNNDMLEERALLLSRLGQYELAFTILAQYLESPEKAESLAEEILSQPTAETGDAADSSLAILQGEVYADQSAAGAPAAEAYKLHAPRAPAPMTQRALQLLKRRPGQIPPVRVLPLLPPATPLADLSDYLLTSLQRLEAEKRLLQSRRGLYHAERLQTAAAFARVRSGRVAIEEGTRCSVCQNRIGASAFARFPSRQVTHYGCMAVMRARLSGRQSGA
uniref:CNH domain-containing protein n=1 Tax=Macrostomum lignano TaxID=282301 RepID=A0A1I8J663_9PLAT